MTTRRSPAATALTATLTAQPAGIHVFVIDGVERLTLTTTDVARLLFGEPTNPEEARRYRDVITDYHRRGILAGRRVGNRLLFPGSAITDFIRSLEHQDTG